MFGLMSVTMSDKQGACLVKVRLRVRLYFCKCYYKCNQLPSEMLHSSAWHLRLLWYKCCCRDFPLCQIQFKTLGQGEYLQRSSLFPFSLLQYSKPSETTAGLSWVYVQFQPGIGQWTMSSSTEPWPSPHRNFKGAPLFPAQTHRLMQLQCSSDWFFYGPFLQGNMVREELDKTLVGKMRLSAPSLFFRASLHPLSNTQQRIIIFILKVPTQLTEWCGMFFTH